MSDDVLIDCAIHERAQFLVTYDNDLLDDTALKRALFEYGIEIVEPWVFLEKSGKQKLTTPDLVPSQAAYRNGQNNQNEQVLSDIYFYQIEGAVNLLQRAAC